MATTYGKRKKERSLLFYTLITAVLLCATFLAMMNYFYHSAEDEAYEQLHVQTKQIKDELVLQLNSDKENLSTMANFAAKLYASGEDYDIMFDSFKPIGLFARIGILKPDYTFITKDETVDLTGKLNFEEEAKLGEHVTGRTYSYSIPGEQVVRCGVPIVVNDETVGIIYGIIKVETLFEKYNTMAEELDAQLFVYDKADGKLIIDTVHNELGNISFLKNREYNDDYSYEQFATTDKGFSSFKSAYRPENVHMHYSAIEAFNWMIALVRYDSQVFAQTNVLFRTLLLVFLILLAIISAYVLILIFKERRTNSIISCAAEIRRALLEVSEHQNHIEEALKQVCLFTKSRSAIFFDTDSERNKYISPDYTGTVLTDKEKNIFETELIHYATNFHKVSKSAVDIMCIKADKHLKETNPTFYNLLKANNIQDITLFATINKINHITILAALNAKRPYAARVLLEKIAACFSIALNNKNQLNNTLLAATTDSLTGVLNRVAYKNDLRAYDEKPASDFSCIYIDVNELHMINNKYGHAAGDEMLVYIANTLKDVFHGHKVYRMGGDEFLVFCQNTQPEEVKQNLAFLEEQLVPRKYHVAVGMSYRSQNNNTVDMVSEAEVKMYEAKSRYYQAKNATSTASGDEYVQINTGIREIDAVLSVLTENYNGIYHVSLATDKARRILMPAYLNYNENEDNFSTLFKKYVEDMVHSDYHRSVMSFLNYDVLAKQLEKGETPQIIYKKNNGEVVVLSVYPIHGVNDAPTETLWVFAKQ